MRASILFAALCLAACTVTAPDEDPMAGDEPDGTDGTTPTPDPDPDPDPPASDPDPDPESGDGCPSDNLGIVDGLKEPSAFLDPLDPTDPDSPAVRILTGQISPTDDFELGLYEGYGAFADAPAAPGDYVIEGDDAAPSSCGVCVYLYMTVGEVEHRFLATSGTVSLESVDGTLKGSGTTLRFRELADLSSFAEGGCASAITRVIYEAALEDPFPDQ